MNMPRRLHRIHISANEHAEFYGSADSWLGCCSRSRVVLMEPRSLRFPTLGANPGNLRMFQYVPDGLPAGRPLVVALHGCTQSAAAYDDETGWKKLAEQLQFALLLPQQRPSNNLKSCFNWFEPRHIGRDQGEALSIKTMIDRMRADQGSDPKRIFVTGLSAGGAMTAVMLATYPEIFAGGAIIAGLPYRCATGVVEALTSCMRPGKNLTPSQWGALVRGASAHQGAWPTVLIWHGDADPTVAPSNAAELIDQWTNVHSIDRSPEVDETVAGHPHRVFKDEQGEARVESYTLLGMGHATPVDPGPGAEQCGTVAAFIADAGICLGLHIARFSGLTSGACPARCAPAARATARGYRGYSSGSGCVASPYQSLTALKTV